MSVAIAATAPSSGEQGDLLSAAWRDAAAMDAALARLRAELGAGSVVRPAERDEHRPDQAGEWVAGRHPSESREPRVEAPQQRVLRLVEDPEPVDVELHMEQGAESPCALWWRGRRVSITRCSEPERLSGKWWDDDGAYRRDYWLCDSENGELLLFVDRIGGDSWYLQGWYD